MSYIVTWNKEIGYDVRGRLKHSINWVEANTAPRGHLILCFELQKFLINCEQGSELLQLNHQFKYSNFTPLNPCLAQLTRWCLPCT